MEHTIDGISRREFVRVLALGAGAALLAACTAAPTPSAPAAAQPGVSTPISAGGTPAGEQPKSGGKLKIARSDDLVTLDGMFFQSNTLGTTYGTVYERLIDFDNQLQAKPVLAESWEFSSDAKQLKLNLRKGVAWHSGREFTSDDVKWNVQRISDRKVANGQWYNFAAWFQSIDTPDKNTVILHMDPARPAALDLFEQLNMVDSVSMSGPDAITRAVGTGPFTYAEWQQGSYLRFARNKNYWQSGKPYLDEVEVDITNDAPTLSVRLESGDAQAISDPPIQDLMRLKQDPNWVILNTNPGYYSLGVNTDPPGANPVLQDKRVRQALNLAIDRQRFTGTVLAGLSEPWNLPWPSYSEAYESAKQSVTAFDLDKAKSVLSSAGVNNAEVEIVYRSTDGELAQFVQIYKADLATIGVNLTIKPLESALYSSVTNQRQYQFAAASSAAAQYHPSTVFYFGGARYFGGVDQATVDAVSSEPDEARRRAMYSTMNDFILDQSLDMVIGQTQRALVFPKSVHGLDRRINQVTYYTETWLQS
ncbi:MAG: ABC transporter substrate-binding protein [Chloroflexi bacterium]|nr:ABC transporter substrate-binding protein [Chloroflexota bacterium]MBV9600911.1 ABC transporter substrate-binding protein [Chloroflexota bacterium]